MLYQARIAVPSNVVTGRYTAETFAIADGRVIASAIAEVEVEKQGFERFVAEQAEQIVVPLRPVRGVPVGADGLARGAAVRARFERYAAFVDAILTALRASVVRERKQ